tara:strand:- start:46214 stop:46747 length:534 start_codon:yes stop_codon:yes gene_type:complete
VSDNIENYTKGILMLNKLIIGLVIIGTTSCSVINTKPYEGNTKKTTIFETSKSKEKAFDDSLSFFAKYMNDSNSAIKVKEREGGRIVVKIMKECRLLNALNKEYPMNISYVADLSLKDNKAKLALELYPFIRIQNLNGAMVDAPIHTKDKQQDRVDACLDGLTKEIQEGVRKKAENW